MSVGVFGGVVIRRLCGFRITGFFFVFFRRGLFLLRSVFFLFGLGGLVRLLLRLSLLLFFRRFRFLRLLIELPEFFLARFNKVSADVARISVFELHIIPCGSVTGLLHAKDRHFIPLIEASDDIVILCIGCISYPDFISY